MQNVGWILKHKRISPPFSPPPRILIICPWTLGILWSRGRCYRGAVIGMGKLLKLASPRWMEAFPLIQRVGRFQHYDSNRAKKTKKFFDGNSKFVWLINLTSSLVGLSAAHITGLLWIFHVHDTREVGLPKEVTDVERQVEALSQLLPAAFPAINLTHGLPQQLGSRLLGQGQFCPG